MVQTLNAPGVSVSVDDQSTYPDVFPTTTPLIILATRGSKTVPGSTGIAAGTVESNVLRKLTSAREVYQTLGSPTFVTSAGSPVHGDETNEYGLHALWDFLRFSNGAYYLRADIDLGQLVPSATEPEDPPVDGTYWIDSGSVVGGFYRRNAADTGWDAVPSSVYTTAPQSGDGSAGDIALDYSTADGIIKIKGDSAWNALGSVDLTATQIQSRTATNDTLWISPTAPTGAGANDYWWKTGTTAGSMDLKLKMYRASDDTWVSVTVVRSTTQPSSPTTGTVWEDLSSVESDGKRPLKIYGGSSFSALTTVVQDTAPSADPSDGTLWYDDTITDFAMYVESSNEWAEVATTTNANPTNKQKVISASAPTSPDSGAIWIDISGPNFDNFPVIKRYTGSSWEDITDSVTIGTYTDPSLVTDGTYFINLDDPSTKNTVKVYDSTYEPVIVDTGTGAAATFDAAVNGRWKPYVGARFGRKAQRYAVVRALQSAISSNDSIRSSAVRFDLVAVPGYPELFDELVTLTTDLKNTVFAVGDTPIRMKPNGVAKGTEITATDWKTNANGASSTGEDGFASSGTWSAALYSPWGMFTNSDGNNVVVPPSTIALRTIAYSDSLAYPWFAPMGDKRGIVSNATSVGYLDDDGVFQTLNLTEGQQGIMYDLDINPIVFFLNSGLRVWGQKTSYGVNSALDRINVARLVAEIKYELEKDLRGFIGDPADPLTWASARNLVNKRLGGIKNLRGLKDYAVRCDENNNTADRIDRNEMWVDVAIKPLKAVEFIYVPIKIVDQAGNVNG